MEHAPFVFVVAAALINPQGHILLAQRNKGKMAGLWEFPGGKVEVGETPKDALIRELKEELAITTEPQHLFPLVFADHAYPGFHLFMPVYWLNKWTGRAEPKIHRAIDWVHTSEMHTFPMPEADLPIVEALKNHNPARHTG